MAKVLAFSGSVRSGSWNEKLVSSGAAVCRGLGAEVTHISLRDYAMPIYDGDDEADHGPPEAARRLHALVADHDGLLIACPEYNSSITPLLKNTIDWVTRVKTDEHPGIIFSGRAVGLIAASPGSLGGLRGLFVVRSIFLNIATHVVPSHVAVSGAHEAFADDGSLADDGMRSRLESLCGDLVRMADALRG